MRLYLLTQRECQFSYDMYDRVIVAAKSKWRAARIHPLGKGQWHEDCWVKSPDLVNVDYIGLAKAGTKEGVILSSCTGG